MERWEAGCAQEAVKDPREADLGDRHRGPTLNLYLDTSALLKLYVDEDGSTLVRGRVEQAGRLATSAVTYVQAHSALARRKRLGDLSPARYRAVLGTFEEGWSRYLRLDVGEGVLSAAARLAGRHVLRAYDSIHLASALVFRSGLEAEVTLASWDDELDAAAVREGLQVLRRGHRSR